MGSVTAVDSRSQSVESESETGVEPLSGYPFPARQEPQITTISSSFPRKTPSFHLFGCAQQLALSVSIPNNR